MKPSIAPCRANLLDLPVNGFVVCRARPALHTGLAAQVISPSTHGPLLHVVLLWATQLLQAQRLQKPCTLCTPRTLSSSIAARGQAIL
jgi:hypothetical protein